MVSFFFTSRQKDDYKGKTTETVFVIPAKYEFSRLQAFATIPKLRLRLPPLFH